MGLVSFSEESSVFTASGCESSIFSMLVFIGGDPVNSGVSSDGLVEGVDEDDFVKLEGTVLTDPVGVENAEILASSSDTVLSHSSVRSVGLELVDTLVDGLAVNDTLANWSLSASSSNSNSVDHVSLLALVAELAGLFWARRSLNLVDDGQLTVLPRSHS